MDSFEVDITQLEQAMRSFFQTMKRPHTWSIVTAKTGIVMDRPSAVMLHILAQQDQSYRVHDLAQLLGVEAPSVTRKTQQLERDGYLERVVDPKDRRAVSLHATPEGKAISKKLWRAQRGFIEQALGNWDESDRKKFIELLERFSTDLASASQNNQQ